MFFRIANPKSFLLAPALAFQGTGWRVMERSAQARASTQQCARDIAFLCTSALEREDSCMP